MSTRREQLLDELRRGAAGHPVVTGECADLLFDIVYGLPFDSVIALVRHMGRRYLPIYARAEPATDVARLLDDPVAWLSAHGCVEPLGTARPMIHANRKLEIALSALLDAAHYPGDLGMVAGSSCMAIDHIIYARALNVYEADDPEGFARWVREDPGSYSPLDHVAYLAIVAREWTEVVAWLHGQEFLRTAPEPDLDAMRRAHARWNAAEHLWMSRESTKPELDDCISEG